MTWLWLFPLVWAFASALATGAWVAMCHIVWLRERRNAHQCVVVQLVANQGRDAA